ncbi:dTDP-4-dehydrorhamnose 3,5-epimerase [Psychroflexus planctonicus]|uniref:dTDP-4-dehydrorhamnose 3,5-epimerase n=1 Tax=Psychroflexus planctonicus TaxID=1526575 RepID=A0ABQ1SHD0_9FLAO|nr:dTDP-4-dehydrorhamnose 3,5-epimerase [Psychroflexus planctonicus]GGE32308.1 dTDP-4-dehydrorhamnose 3,5-epimerase [Psychroflexus planctonicus]
MTITKTNIQEAYIIQPQVFKDERGYFFESFNQEKFQNETRITTQFVQDNESMSNYGVIRGLHAQSGEFAQAKLIRVIQGKVLDVIVDARKESPTYGEIFTIELNAENKKQLFVPKGCLHGFSVLEDQTIFSYKCDAYYNKASEIGVHPLDQSLAIHWQVPEDKQLLSEKDRLLPSWEDFLKNNSEK